MVNEIKIPPQIYATSYNIVWGNLVTDTYISENFVIDIASARYKDAKVFDNFNMDACQLVLYKIISVWFELMSQK